MAEQEASSAAARLEQQQGEGQGEPATAETEQLELAKRKLAHQRPGCRAVAIGGENTTPRKQARGWKGSLRRRSVPKKQPGN